MPPSRGSGSVDPPANRNSIRRRTDRPSRTSDEAARVERTFTIAPETLVLAAAPDVPLLIAHGVPGAAVERHQNQFITGLLGAVIAIASAIAFAIMLGGGFGS